MFWNYFVVQLILPYNSPNCVRHNELLLTLLNQCENQWLILHFENKICSKSVFKWIYCLLFGSFRISFLSVNGWTP